MDMTNWALVGESEGPGGEQVLVYLLPGGEFTYCVNGNAAAWGTYRTRSWLDAISHYSRQSQSWNEATEPSMFCPFKDEASTVRPAIF